MSAAIVLALRILIAAGLYAFAGYAFYLLWKTLRTGEGQRARQPILVLQPAGQPESAAHRLTTGEVIVGRGKACGLCLEGETISTRHARLSYHNRQWWVEDLGSTNGTLLNGLPVNTPTVLVKDDELVFGRHHLTVSFENTPPAH